MSKERINQIVESLQLERVDLSNPIEKIIVLTALQQLAQAGEDTETLKQVLEEIKEGRNRYGKNKETINKRRES